MPEYMRAYVERAKSDSKTGEPMRFIASTENVARDGMVIDADAWDLTNYRKNPVMLFSHDYFSRPPIGKVTDIVVEDKRLIADVVFDQNDEFAVSIERKYRDGFLSAVSVGWDTLSFEPPNGPNSVGRVTKADLLDISAVMVPSDPDALKERQKRGLASVVEELNKIIEPSTDDNDDRSVNMNGAITITASDPEALAKQLRSANPSATVTVNDDGTVTQTFPLSNPKPHPDPPARATWEETAAAMVRVFRPFAQRPDAEREADYQRLAREYARHKKTAPEFQTSAQLEALGADELRGLFLEGEAELFPDEFAAMSQRAGAVLSARNRSDLETIRDLADAILNRSKKDEAEEAERADAEAATRLIELFGVTTS